MGMLRPTAIETEARLTECTRHERKSLIPMDPIGRLRSWKTIAPRSAGPAKAACLRIDSRPFDCMGSIESRLVTLNLGFIRRIHFMTVLQWQVVGEVISAKSEPHVKLKKSNPGNKRALIEPSELQTEIKHEKVSGLSLSDKR